jgi:DNA-directed RNA polymerase subunit RPC12/RpoP
MEREYTCVDCGATFVLDTKMKCAARRCPECNRLRVNQRNSEWRKRERRKAFDNKTEIKHYYVFKGR